MKAGEMSNTIWTELQAANCQVTCVDDHNGSIAAIQIKHAALKRALWFIKSQAGNWYWRGNDASYIIKSSFDQAMIDKAPRRKC